MAVSNPLLSAQRFGLGGWYSQQERMTFEGVLLKTGILLACLWVPAIYVWNVYSHLGAGAVGPFLLVGLVGGLITGLITAFVARAAPVTAPLYAVFEGLFVGGISAILEATYPGIVLQAMFATIGVLAGMLLLYATRIIRVTQTVRAVVLGATAGIMVAYLVSFLLSLFGVFSPFIYDNGPLGIGFSLFVVVVIAFNLAVDFDNIERGVRASAPKAMEWYAAFGLMVSLIWLYLELLRLFSKFYRR